MPPVTPPTAAPTAAPIRVELVLRPMAWPRTAPVAAPAPVPIAAPFSVLVIGWAQPARTATVMTRQQYLVNISKFLLPYVDKTIFPMFQPYHSWPKKQPGGRKGIL